MPRPRRRLNQEKIDLITDYLANHAQKEILTLDEIDAYRKAHKNRLKWGNKGWSVRDPKHKNNPFCNICDEEFQPGDYVYGFHVRALLIYHVECFDNTRWRKQLSIIYQDRAYRKKHPPKEIEKEPEVTEFYKPLREESWRLYEELRKEHVDDVE